MGQKWTEDELEQLFVELNENLDLEKIAEIHERTIGSIRSKRNQILYEEYKKNNNSDVDNDEFVEDICYKFNIKEKEFWELIIKHDTNESNKLKKKTTTNTKKNNIDTDKLLEKFSDKLDNKFEVLKEIILSKDYRIDKLEGELNEVKSQMKKMNKNLKLILEKIP